MNLQRRGRPLRVMPTVPDWWDDADALAAETRPAGLAFDSPDWDEHIARAERIERSYGAEASQPAPGKACAAVRKTVRTRTKNRAHLTGKAVRSDRKTGQAKTTLKAIAVIPEEVIIAMIEEAYGRA